MTEFRAITEERYKQLEEHPELRADATEEIWAEMVRMRNTLLTIISAHYTMLDWKIWEGCGDRSLEECEKYHDYLKRTGVGITEDLS